MIVAIRGTARSFREVRLICDWAMVAPTCRNEVALFTPIRHDMVP